MSNEQQSNVSRRDFVRTAAVGVGGVGMGIIAGRGFAPAGAAQSGQAPAPAPAAVSHEKLAITISPSVGGGNAAPQGQNRIAPQAAGALEGSKAGAAIVHLRAGRIRANQQTPQGRQGPDLGDWRQLTETVRSQSNLVVNYGSSAMEPDLRKQLLALKPEAGSFLVGHHYGGMAVPEENQRQYAIDHLEAGVLPEVEIFHTGDAANFNRLIDKGLLKPPFCVTLFIEYHDYYYYVPATRQQLEALLAVLPPNTHWTVVSRGPRHFELATHAIELGGNVRTGLENTPELSPGKPARTQAECVERMVEIGRSVGRDIATPDEARQMLGLPRKPETLTT